MPGRTIAEDLAVALRFYSRLPLPARGDHPHAAPDLDRMAYAIPLAGVVLGGLAGLVLLLSSALHLPPTVAAALAVTTLALITGAMQEDGLADTADGLGGGRDRAHRLAIMRDSRIGAFGATALALALILRVSSLAAIIAAAGAWPAALVVMAAAAASRAVGILLLRALPSARVDGASAAVGQPSPKAASACGMTAALVIAVILVPTFGVSTTFAALVAPLLALAACAVAAHRLLGGQTGDVAGAAQNLSEIALLIAVLAVPGK